MSHVRLGEEYAGPIVPWHPGSGYGNPRENRSVER